MRREASDIIISINIAWLSPFLSSPLFFLLQKSFFGKQAANFAVLSLAIQTENMCSILLMLGGCFIYKVVGNFSAKRQMRRV
jgi:hypothetical protein